VSGMTSLTSRIYKGNRASQQRSAKIPAASTDDAVKEGIINNNNNNNNNNKMLRLQCHYQ